MALFDNTLESTSETSLLGDAGSSGLATRLGACHSVPKTFQNAHTCRPSTACSPVTYRDTSVVLNHSSLLTFHQLTGSHIYAVTGLRLGTAGVTSPCIGTARWRKLAAPCGAAETALDDATKATLAQAIRGSTDAIQPVCARRHPEHGRQRHVHVDVQRRLGDRRQGECGRRVLGALAPAVLQRV